MDMPLALYHITPPVFFIKYYMKRYINCNIELADIKKYPNATQKSNDKYFISSQFSGKRGCLDEGEV